MAYSILSQSDAQYNPFDQFFTQNVGHLKGVFLSLFFLYPLKTVLLIHLESRGQSYTVLFENDSILFRLKVFQLEYKLQMSQSIIKSIAYWFLIFLFTPQKLWIVFFCC